MCQDMGRKAGRIETIDPLELLEQPTAAFADEQIHV